MARGVHDDGVCMGDQTEEPLTEELLELLLKSTSPESYLQEANLPERTLSDYLGELLKAKRLTRSEVIRSSGVTTTFAYQIFQGTRRPGRDNAIMLAIALSCTLVEAQRLLRLAGVSELWVKTRRDAIIIFCLEHGYTREQTDDELYRMGEKTLLNEGSRHE